MCERASGVVIADRPSSCSVTPEADDSEGVGSMQECAIHLFLKVDPPSPKVIEVPEP